MKIQIEANDLSEAISWVTKDYDEKAHSFVILTVNKNGKGSLAHRSIPSFLKQDLNFYSVKLEVSEGEETVITLDGAQLRRINTILQNAKMVDLTFKDGATAVVGKTSFGKFTIPVIALKKNDKIYQLPELVELGEVDGIEWFDTLTKIGKIASPETAGNTPSVGAVHIRLQRDGNGTVAATDRFVIAESFVKYTQNANVSEDDLLGEDEIILLPKNAALRVSPLKDSVPVTLIYDAKGKAFGYRFVDGRLGLFQLLEASPMPYAKIKNNFAPEGSVTLNKDEFIRNVSYVANLSPAEEASYFTLNDNTMTIKDSFGTNSFSLAVEGFEGEELEVSFLRAVLTKSYSPLTTSKIKLSWSAGEKVWLMNPILDDGSEDSTWVIVVSYQGK